MTIDISVLRRFKPIRRGISKIFKKNILSGIWLVLAASLSHGSVCKNEDEINRVISAINTGKNVESGCAFLRGCDAVSNTHLTLPTVSPV